MHRVSRMLRSLQQLLINHSMKKSWWYQRFARLNFNFLVCILSFHCNKNNKKIIDIADTNSLKSTWSKWRPTTYFILHVVDSYLTSSEQYILMTRASLGTTSWSTEHTNVRDSYARRTIASVVITKSITIVSLCSGEVVEEYHQSKEKMCSRYCRDDGMIFR
jgi:hypothetical protein